MLILVADASGIYITVLYDTLVMEGITDVQLVELQLKKPIPRLMQWHASVVILNVHACGRNQLISKFGVQIIYSAKVYYTLSSIYTKMCARYTAWKRYTRWINGLGTRLVHA